MDLWNVKNLEPPPVMTCKSTIKEIDYRLLSIALTQGLDFFNSQQHLYTEAALLSRIVYRLKMKFRSSKDFKALEKLSRVLRTYLHLQMPRLLETLVKTTPRDYQPNKSLLFTKNMLDYVLVRLQGLGKVLLRILDTCKEVSYLTRQRVHLGHFWKIAIIVYAITARVFVITKSILKYSCNLYQDLLPFSASVNNAGPIWLPDDYVFPEPLDEWLGIDWLNLDKTVIEIPDEDQTVMSYYNLIDDSDDDVEFCNEYVLVNDSISLNPSAKMKDVKHESDSNDNKEALELVSDDEQQNEEEVDVGEIINLSDIESQSKNERITNRGKQQPLTKLSKSEKRKLKKQKKRNVAQQLSVSDRNDRLPSSPTKKLKRKQQKANKAKKKQQLEL